MSVSGIYKTIYDRTTNEVLLYKVEFGNVIGAASPAGWSHADNQKINPVGTVSETEAKFELSEVVLRKGEYKIRFNSRWKIDRRTNKENFDATSGYVALTNYGGSLSLPVAGGPNFTIAEGADAKYKVTLTWTPSTGFKIAVVKTGDAPVVTFDPTINAWGVTGAATPGGWPNDATPGPDAVLNYEGVSAGTYTWKITVALTADEFKFRTNKAWVKDLGYAGVTITGAGAGELSNVGGNFKAATAGSYSFTLSTSDAGATYTLNVVKN